MCSCKWKRMKQWLFWILSSGRRCVSRSPSTAGYAAAFASCFGFPYWQHHVQHVWLSQMTAGSQQTGNRILWGCIIFIAVFLGILVWLAVWLRDRRRRRRRLRRQRATLRTLSPQLLVHSSTGLSLPRALLPICERIGRRIIRCESGWFEFVCRKTRRRSCVEDVQGSTNSKGGSAIVGVEASSTVIDSNEQEPCPEQGVLDGPSFVVPIASDCSDERCLSSSHLTTVLEEAEEEGQEEEVGEETATQMPELPLPCRQHQRSRSVPAPWTVRIWTQPRGFSE